MKILIVTQKIDSNDDLLGFMHNWILEFFRQCEAVVAVGLSVGEYDLPSNVKLFSLGKNKVTTGLAHLLFRIKFALRFISIIIRERKNYDVVLVHMNHEYVIIGAPFWKIMGKKIALWYAHGFVPKSLHISLKLADVVFTSTESGFRIKSPKKKVIGQGIDTDFFVPDTKREDRIFTIITVGRISPAKDLETLIRAVSIFQKKGEKFVVKIVGAPGTDEQIVYAEEMKNLTRELGLATVFQFVGSVANKNLPNILRSADLFVNMGQTGSLDKAMVEAMSAGVPVLSSNEAMLEVFGPYTEKLMYPKKDFSALSEKIEDFILMPEKSRLEIGMGLRNIVINNHSLKNFVSKIVGEISK
ncbi:MAG: glycosyltransferase [Patescibacteria group bacterium]